MNDKPILDAVADEIHDVVDATRPGLLSRRAAVKRTAGLSAGTAAALAMGSMPIAFAALSREAGAQTISDTARQVLLFAYLLENFEAEFYKAVLGSSSNAAYNTAFAPVRAQVAALPETTRTPVLNTLTLIRDHEIAHVSFLGRLLGSSAPTYTPASFDFTGGRGSQNGPFLRATNDLAFLLAVTQAVEDTGVRAYKGQAANLLRDATVLPAALGIHSVEARHAARIRRIRRTVTPTLDVVRYSGTIRGGGADAAGAGNVNPAPSAQVVAAFAGIYGAGTNATVAPSEANVTQGGVDLTAIAASAGGASAVQEAFDEPLARADVVALVQPFVVANIS